MGSPVSLPIEGPVVLIAAVCPRCKTSYQVQDDLRGRPMRCPKPNCRQVFIVGQPLPPAGPTSGGQVGELVPLVPAAPNTPASPGTHVSDFLELLPAEPVGVDPVLERAHSAGAPPAWQQGPPARRGGDAPLRPMTQLSPDEGGPRVVAYGGDHSAAPPPVRRGDDDLEPLEEVPDHPAPARRHTSLDPHAAPRPRGRWVWVVGTLLVLVAGFIGGGYAIYRGLQGGNETKYAAEADELYANGQYRGARDLYTQLKTNFASSDREPYYAYREALSDLRLQLNDPADEPVELFSVVEQFVKDHVKGPFLADDAPELSEAFLKVLLDYANRHVDAPADEAPLKALDKAKPALAALKKIKLPKDAKRPDWSRLDEVTTRLAAAVERVKRFKAAVADIKAAAAKPPSLAVLVELEQTVARHAIDFPELPRSKEVTEAFDLLYEGHLQSVRYIPGPVKKPAATVKEEDATSLLFDMLIGGEQGGGAEGTVLALARGVLYALKADTGEVRWVTRVGIDTTALPVRVPARADRPEMVLVLSSDTATLSAYDIDSSDGVPRWSYRLGSPSLGKPVVVDGQAYLGTTGGDVYEIELSEGKLLGRYQIGQRLTLGATREPGSKRLYFAADEGCVYVLDVAKKRCVTILYSRHAAGALRCEPALIPPQGDDVPGLMVLNEANGLQEVRLRVFELPLRGRESRELALSPPPTLEGWTWFQPKQDPEKLVMLSDRGVLGLFGIKQAHNRDQALFSMLPGGGQRLEALMAGSLSTGGRPAARSRQGRAEVVQMLGDDLWVLASDRLQRLRFGWGLAEGPRLSPAWDDPPELGSPLHSSQVHEGPAGDNRLTLVTQPRGRSVVWASNYDDETGKKLYWRRQLGIVAQGDPVKIDLPGEEPLWLVPDQSGALFVLDPKRYNAKPGAAWHYDPKLKQLAQSLEENADWPPVILPARDGKAAYVLTAPGAGRELVVRHLTRVAGERRLHVSEGTVRLPATPAGRPALVGSYLLLALSDGNVVRLSLPLADDPEGPEIGPRWRAARVAPESPGHVVALSEDRFLLTDGGNGLHCYSWPGDLDTLKKLPKLDDAPTLEMKDRIVTAPVVLPPGKPGALQQVLVAGSGGLLSLVEVRANGALALKHEWDVGGPVTSGPFLRTTPDGLRIGCIVERNWLVWIDPTKPKVLWRHGSDDSEIVGQPQLVAGRVTVVDQAGRYRALDRATGKAVGKEHQLRGSVAPMASPVELLPGRALAPLSDGTMLLLKLGEKTKKAP